MMRFWNLVDRMFPSTESGPPPPPPLDIVNRYRCFSISTIEEHNHLLDELITKLESTFADKVFVAAGYTKADLIADLKRLKQ